MRKRRRRRNVVFTLFLLLFCIGAGWLFVRGLFTSPSEQAQKVVDDFYRYEQEGNFSKSWEMFHPFIKEKFTKGHYVQERAQVFINHFGVESFSYTLGEPEELEKWRVSADGPELSFVYKVPVVQVYKGKYGNFSLHQDVFVVQEKENWFILWDYNQ
ncbi:hypothetical protein [Bacillus sp. FJAT-27231]|uniref:hypothetical protein n=1 Tax=Bacillus sp. FJAT-27231 TaxID=1679168 RepID=UPI00067083BA|nr:hypothetical protein [Bacillus sp. FJAT-27231]